MDVTGRSEHGSSCRAARSARVETPRTDQVRAIRAWGADESGQAVAEFAIVAVLLCLLVFGITQFGQAFNTANDETHLADMAARYAAVNYNPSTSGQSFIAWVKAQGGTSFSKNGTICISFPNNTSNVGDPVKIVAKSSSFSLQPLTALFQVAHKAGLPTPITIQGQAVMRLEAAPTVYGAGCA
jgi:hypothetical protein